MSCDSAGAVAASQVVIAEHDDLTAALIQYSLQAPDLHPVRARDGLDTLELLARVQPRVLVLDTHMPRRSGMEILRQVRLGANGSRPRVLVLSGLLTAELRESLQQAGADDFMSKPFDPAELDNRVRQLLAS